MRVLLVNTDLPERQITKTLPLSMYFIAGLLRKYNHEVDVLDPMLYRSKFFNESIYEAILNKSYKTDIICFSVNTFSLGYMLKIIKSLRSSGYNGKIILGGVHPTHEPNDVISNGEIDYVIIGEAENTLPKLLDNIENNKYEILENVFSKHGNGKISNKLYNISNIKKEDYIFPAYDLVPKGAYNTITIEASRGCYGNCTFCSIPNKKCWRGYPIEYVIDNIKNAMNFIEERFCAESICFTDDCFTIDLKRASYLLNTFSEMPIRNYFMLIEARLAHLMNYEVRSAIKKLPNISIQVGIECGYDKGLKKINKGITKEQILKYSKFFYEEGISKSLFYSFIIGFPWETFDDCNKTLDLMCFLKNTYGITVNCSWWLPVPSIEFEILKDLDKTIDNNIFNKNGWVNNRTIFKKSHPLLTETELYNLTQRIANEGLMF